MSFKFKDECRIVSFSLFHSFSSISVRFVFPQIESATGLGDGIMGVFYLQHGPDWSVISGNTSGITQVGLASQIQYKILKFFIWLWLDVSVDLYCSTIVIIYTSTNDLNFICVGFTHGFTICVLPGSHWAAKLYGIFLSALCITALIRLGGPGSHCILILWSESI